MAKQKLLFTVCSLEVGGIERSLIGLLDELDYDKYDVDLLLFSRKGEFLQFVNKRCNILPEIPQCAMMTESIKSVLISGHPLMTAARLYSKLEVSRKYANSGYTDDAVVFASLQSFWDNSIRFMPKLKKEYDAAISFMWPHHFVAQKVSAKKKIAWVHTDYTKAALDNRQDEKIWDDFDSIAAVSDDCGKAFVSVYPLLAEKVTTVENILSSDFVRAQAKAFVPKEMEAEGFTKLLTVGRFCYAKAFDVAIDICKILVDRGVKIKWFAVGYGAEQANAEQKAKDLGLEDSFIILGKKINPYPYMKSCDIYVQPSRYEGKAVTVREAQILGRAVIITDFTTARSQVRDGFDAMISPMGAENVADCIEKLINDEAAREKLSKNAFNTDYGCEEPLRRFYEFVGEEKA